MNNIGNRIYELRLQSNISQDALADKLGVSRQAISKWENSQSVPELEKLVRMSEIFGVSLDHLVKGECNAVNASGNSGNNTDKGFSGEKIKQIIGLIFIGAGILFLLVHLILAAVFIAEGVYLLFYKSDDVRIIIGGSLIVVFAVPVLLYIAIMLIWAMFS